MSLSAARQLLKATVDQRSQRKRVTGNIFTTLSGRALPRQGFLSLEILRAIYLRSEVVRACIDMIIEMFCAVDWEIKPVDEDRANWLKRRRPEEYVDQQNRIKWAKKFFKHPNEFDRTLDKFHRRMLRDLLIFDAGAYEIVPAFVNGRRLPLEIGVIAGDTVELEPDIHGNVVSYHQSYNVLHRTEFSRDEIAYLQQHVCSWQPYGISPIETAFISITADLNANKFNSDFFSKNGIPPGLLAVLGVSKEEFRNIQAQLRSTSADNPHNVHSFRAQRNPDGGAQKIFEFIPLTQANNREMQFRELLEHVARRVCMSYKITPSQIGLIGDMAGGIGNGIAEEQAALTQNKAIAPLLELVAETHTHSVLHNTCGWSDLEFKFTASNTPQEKEEYERDSRELQVGAMTINEFRQKHGARKPVAWGDEPLSPTVGYQGRQGPEQLQQQAIAAGMGGGMPAPGGAPMPQPAPPAPAPQPMQKSILIRW